MRKNITLPILAVTLLFLLASLAHASVTPQPIGIVAVKAIGIPKGTVAEAQLSWSFNGFGANATSTSPTCTLNLTQVLSADTNKTIGAGVIATALSKVYANDTDPYTVPANASNIAQFDMNMTLSDHYIKNETWITSIHVAITGKADMTCDTKANVSLYNFTSGSFVDLGTALNATTNQNLSYDVPSGNETFFVDENNNNTVLLEFFWEDTTTPPNVDIDYVEVSVTYDLSVSITDWEATETEISYGVSRVFDHTDTFNLTTPSGVTDHNFTIYYETPNYPLITQIGKAVTVTVSDATVNTVSPITFNITNLVTNITTVNCHLPLVHIVTPSATVTITQASFQGGINKLSFQASGTGTQTITARIKALPYGIYVDTHTLPSANYTWSNGILTMNITLSTHTIEIYQYNPSPPLPPQDSDNDGWSDSYEISVGTDPNNPDTDGDGIIDSLDPDPKAAPPPAYTIVTPIGAIPIWLIILLIIIIGAIGYIRHRIHPA